MTALSVVERTDETYYVGVRPGSGCASYVGFQGASNGQLMLIASWCNHLNIAHEILHAAGFYHEHTRMDHDEYVTIDHNNVRSDAQQNFKGVSVDITDRYNYDSVMRKSKHFLFENSYRGYVDYSQTAFAVDPTKATITEVPQKSMEFINDEGPYVLG